MEGLILVGIFMMTMWLITIAMITKIVKGPLDPKPMDEEEFKAMLMGKSPEYSEKVLDFIRNFAAQVAIMHFRQFLDSRATDKVTREQTKNLARDVATTVRSYIDNDKIDHRKLMFTIAYLDEFIVQVSVNAVKDLLKKAVDEALIEEADS